jgi:hypothetical protein
MPENTKSLLEQGPANALGEGAARFDRLIEDVKASQSPAPVRTTTAVIANPLLSVSPGEEWSRQFQSQSFGPEVRGVSYSDLAPVPRAMVMPELAPDIVPQRSTAFAPKSALQGMGSEIGKRPERPRRSWLGRMLHGA